MSSRGELRIGCSGWNYKDWRGTVYPKGEPQRRWLELYSELFDTVEVNSTFYGTPKPKSVSTWAEGTPPCFLFAVKASRYLTHIKRLANSEVKNFKLREGIARFYEPLEPLREAGKLGPTLWQLPGNFQRDDDRLRAAIELLPEGRHAFEFRHPSWFTAPVYRLLGEYDAALVIADDPERTFTTREISPPHGPSSASIAAAAGGAATIRRRSSRPGSAGSPHGAEARMSTPTSTTTGRPSLLAMR